MRQYSFPISKARRSRIALKCAPPVRPRLLLLIYHDITIGPCGSQRRRARLAAFHVARAGPNAPFTIFLSRRVNMPAPGKAMPGQGSHSVCRTSASHAAGSVRQLLEVTACVARHNRSKDQRW
jgi:hypothetical protein